MVGCRLNVIKLLHHELPAELVAQEEGTVGWEGADHGGGEPGVQCSHAYTGERAFTTDTLTGRWLLFILQVNS